MKKMKVFRKYSILAFALVFLFASSILAEYYWYAQRKSAVQEIIDVKPTSPNYRADVLKAVDKYARNQSLFGIFSHISLNSAAAGDSCSDAVDRLTATLNSLVAGRDKGAELGRYTKAVEEAQVNAAEACKTK